MTAKRNRKPMALKVDAVTQQQRQRAAAILEVLAGVRTPNQAATALSMSVGSYYKLETRAVQALIDGCRPGQKGPKPSLQTQLDQLQRRCGKLEQELQRYQALARAAQRAVGLARPKVPKADAAGRKTRRPTVRALKAVEMLKTDNDGDQATPSS